MPAPTLKLKDNSEDRPKVEFWVKRTVTREGEDGVPVTTEETSKELFQVKLHKELTLGDYEEVNRLDTSFAELRAQRDQMPNSEWIFQLIFNYRRLMAVAFYDPIPDEALYGLTLARLEETTDFLFNMWPEDLKEQVRKMGWDSPSAT